MNSPSAFDSVRSSRMEVFLSRTYERIRRTTIVLGVTGGITAAALFGWRNGLGILVGAAVGYVNLAWLHQGSGMIIERLLVPPDRAPSKLRLTAAFTLRYGFVLCIAYGIIKGLPNMVLSFTVGLFLPILAATCEGVYEVFVSSKQ